MAADHNEAMNAEALTVPAATPVALPTGAVRLSDWGVIRAQGADAAKFLHGQLTQDVEHLPESEVRLAGFCSAKGRLLASFVMWRRGPEEVLLACSADLLPATLKRLSMFVLRAKCKLSDASAELPLWGLAGTAAGAAASWTRSEGASGEQLQLPAALVDGQPVARALWVGAPGTAPEATAMDLAAWQALEVLSGVARIVAATSEQFVPQMVNLELVGGVNFKKGCYPGQEVVARSQYRGTLKRRAYVLTGDTALQPGQEVFIATEPEQPAGMVALAGQLAGQQMALVEMKIAAVESGALLHAGSATGPALKPGALPYDLARDDS
jgi:folate-binding protein YgfZ